MRTHPSNMAEIGAAASSEPHESRGIDVGCFGLSSGLFVISPIELSQCTRCQPNLGKTIPELRWEVRRLDSGLDLLGRTVVLGELVCGLSLSILRPRHGRLSSVRSGGWKERIKCTLEVPNKASTEARLRLDHAASRDSFTGCCWAGPTAA